MEKPLSKNYNIILNKVLTPDDSRCNRPPLQDWLNFLEEKFEFSKERPFEFNNDFQFVVNNLSFIFYSLKRFDLAILLCREAHYAYRNFIIQKQKHIDPNNLGIIQCGIIQTFVNLIRISQKSILKDKTLKMLKKLRPESANFCLFWENQDSLSRQALLLAENCYVEEMTKFCLSDNFREDFEQFITSMLVTEPSQRSVLILLEGQIAYFLKHRPWQCALELCESISVEYPAHSTESILLQIKKAAILADNKKIKIAKDCLLKIKPFFLSTPTKSTAQLVFPFLFCMQKTHLLSETCDVIDNYLFAAKSYPDYILGLQINEFMTEKKKAFSYEFFLGKSGTLERAWNLLIKIRATWNF